MTESEFKNKIKKVKSSRKYKITGSIGNYDIYKIIRKNKWQNIGHPVTEKDFYRIIRSMNLAISQQLIDGKEVVLPCRMGSLELRKNLRKVAIKDNKVITNSPIDWNATLSLWYKDDEARQDKIIVRTTNNEIYRIHYDKSKAAYTNKSFYSFSMNRNIKQALKHRISYGDVDAYLLYNYD